MRIIGIDPGTICCGYGIVETAGARREPVYVAAGDIRLNRKDPLQRRLGILYSSLQAIIRKYDPSRMCLEKIFYHKSIRSALALGSIRGIALLLAAQQDIPVFEHNSTELKMALTGYGRAEKRQVQEMVKRILGLDRRCNDLSEDSTDALALCVCHIHSASKLK